MNFNVLGFSETFYNVYTTRVVKIEKIAVIYGVVG